MANPATFIALLDAARHFTELERLRDTRPTALGGEAAAIRAVRSAGEALQAAALAYAAAQRPSAAPKAFVDEPTAAPVTLAGEETTKVHRVRRQPSAER